MTVKQAAREILSRKGEAHYGDIAREIQDQRLAQIARLAGQSPEETVYTVIMSDIGSKGQSSEFVRVGRPGWFALRDTSEPAPPPEPSDGAEHVQVVKQHRNVPMPTSNDLLWPTLSALDSLGGSAAIAEIPPVLAQILDLPVSVMTVLHGDGPKTEVEYRADWARTYLRKIGAVVNPSRGVWAITAQGRDIESEERVRELVRVKLRETSGRASGPKRRTSPGVHAHGGQPARAPTPNAPDIPGRGRAVEERPMPVPTTEDLLWPTLRALKALGGSADIQEIPPKLAGLLDLPESVMSVRHGDNSKPEIECRAAQSMTYLNKIGAVENRYYGVWSITTKGKGIDSEERLRELVYENLKIENGNKSGRNRLPVQESDRDWKRQILRLIRQMEADEFEFLCQRILEATGFGSVDVTGRSDDQRFEGIGTLPIDFLSFRVAFLCMCHAGSLDSGEIRDFRGGWVGRADKGLVMTTGTFTRSASDEAERDGIFAINLVDGDLFCELLKKHCMGISVETIERVHVDENFFKTQ